MWSSTNQEYEYDKVAYNMKMLWMLSFCSCNDGSKPYKMNMDSNLNGCKGSVIHV